MHHALDPEPTGTVGAGAVWRQDASGRRTQADPLRCELAGWLGDDLVGVHPDFLVSGRLADALRSADLTGYELRDAIVTTSPEFVSHDGELPTRWERLVPTGDPGSDDDLAPANGELLVSERALALLNGHRIVEARLAAAGDTAEAARFARQRDEARAAANERAEGERAAQAAFEAGEAARLTTLLAASASLATPPTMRTNARREISGHVTVAAAALGGTIEDDRALAALRLADGPIEVDEDGPTYRSADRSLSVHTRRGVVTGVEFVLRPHDNAPEAAYPHTSSLVDGVDPFTREALLDRLGDPKATKGRRFTYDEYRIGRQRVLFYWAKSDLSPAIVVVGTKA